MLLDLRSLWEASAAAVIGTANLTEDDDLLVAAVAVLVRGDATLSEAGDTLAAAAVVLVTGTAAITEGDDSVSAAGVALISGSAALAEGHDSLAATVAVLVQASASINEADDSLVAAGSTLPEIVGDAALTDEADIVVADGLVTDTPVSTVGLRPKRPYKQPRYSHYPPLWGGQPQLEPALAAAELTEGDDLVRASASVAWAQRPRLVREREYFERLAA